MPQKIVLVTGISGAGRSATLKILEDQGYDSIDNLPLTFLLPLIQESQTSQHLSDLAIGIDIRAHDFDPDVFRSSLHQLQGQTSFHIQLLYLDCEDEILIRRFSETRRAHPIKAKTLQESIQKERQAMSSLQRDAHVVLNTSSMRPVDLRQHLSYYFARADSLPLLVKIISFSYRWGVPKEADMILDARFLENPYYDLMLRPQNGQDPHVQAFLKNQEAWEPYYASLQTLLDLSLKGFQKTGRRYFHLACGCTGGQHRSVFLAEELGRWLQGQNVSVMIVHRELEEGH